MMEDKCKNCKFFHELVLLDSNGIPDHKGSRSCCVMLPRTEPGYDAFVLEVDGEGVCEMFSIR
jgi:hypothetical protein